jgi:hypothetical protein
MPDPHARDASGISPSGRLSRREFPVIEADYREIRRRAWLVFWIQQEIQHAMARA